ncbi:transposase [Kitasatospora sp. NPDC093102]|uniref:transposase n=1 Tax=Kitasatospora sp. NPDC093102 TaxID=3155069 RepID=UPI00343418BC
MTHPVVAVGASVRFDGREWTVAVLEGARVTLVGDGGTTAAVLLPYLLAAEGFEVIGGDPVPGIPPFTLLDGLPAKVRERALDWQRHVLEVETGFPDRARSGLPRPEYDPAVRSMAQREVAKAVELSAAGWAAGVGTVRRMRARYRVRGLWGLVDGRVVRGGSRLGRADERVVAVILRVLKEQRGRSSGTLSRLRRQVGWALEEEFGEGAVVLPPASTFNRLVHALADGQGLLGSAVQRRRRSSRPTPPFTPTVALRPGELVMLDSTPLDVMAVLEDGVVARLGLVIALDVATRSICAVVLRPAGAKAVDAALLLAQMVTPMAMRAGWDEALSMRRSAVPFERLVALDARLAGAAARPVIVPEMVVVDQGAVFVSQTFVGACESLGVSVQPVPPANGPAKGNVERAFRSIGTGFSQYVAGCTGSDVSQRGEGVEEEAVWNIAQLRDLLDEWVVAGWQERRHGALRHPLLPKVSVSPNEMWAALVGLCGHVPLPLSGTDFVELLEVKWLAVNDYGIRFDYRTYDLDHPWLNDCRGRRSARQDKKGRWEVRCNPHDPGQVWVRTPQGWLEVPWVHRTLVTLPFTANTWDYVRGTVERREGRAEHEAQLARVLDDLLRRADRGLGSKRERAVAAKARAGALAAGTDLGRVAGGGASGLAAAFGYQDVVGVPGGRGWHDGDDADGVDEEVVGGEEWWADDPGEDGQDDAGGDAPHTRSEGAGTPVCGQGTAASPERGSAQSGAAPRPARAPACAGASDRQRPGAPGPGTRHGGGTYDAYEEAQRWTAR